MEVAEAEQSPEEGHFGPTLEPGKRFSRYEIVRFVGRGAMSEVYEATHLDLEKPVALKLLRTERVDNQTARARFLREGRAAARLRHPGVVEIFDVGEQDGRPFLVMELLEGKTLEEHISEHGRFPAEQAIQLILPIASAVQIAHDAGVVHRDLKPENIFLTQDGPRRIRPKIVDFGISSFLDRNSSKLTMDTDILGTPQYMAPEQARGESLDARADQYSLGVILFELLSARVPHERASLVDLLHAVAYEPGDSLSVVAPDLPKELTTVVDKALAHKADDRHGSVLDFALALVDHASPAARDFWLEELTNRDKPTTTTDSRLEKSPFVITLTSTRPPTGAGAVEVTPANNNARGAMLIGGAIVIAILIALGGYLVSRPGEPEELPEAAATSPQTAEVASDINVQLRTVPDTARILLNGEEVAVGHFTESLPPREDGYELDVTADGFQTRRFRFHLEPPPRVVVLSRDGEEPLAAPPPMEVVDPPPTPRTPRVRTALQQRRAFPMAAAPPPPDPEPVEAPEPEPEPEPPPVAAMEEPPAAAPAGRMVITMGSRLTDNLDPFR